MAVPDKCKGCREYFACQETYGEHLESVSLGCSGPVDQADAKFIHSREDFLQLRISVQDFAKLLKNLGPAIILFRWTPWTDHSVREIGQHSGMGFEPGSARGDIVLNLDPNII